MDTFEPYTIGCVTCGAQLRVEREDAIGKILSCPKCESMVQIGPPDIQSGIEPVMEPTEPTSGEAAYPGKTPRQSDRDAFARDPTDLIIESSATPSRKLPQWILLPLAALAGILLTMGLWSATRQNRAPETKEVPAETNSDATEAQETPDVLSVDKSVDKENSELNEEAITATSPANPETTSATETENSTDKNPAPLDNAQNDSLEPNVSNETEDSERNNPLRTNSQIAEEQETPEPRPTSNEITIESNPRLPLPPPAPEMLKNLKTKLQDIQLKETSLQNAIAMLSRLSATNISLDHAALIRTGLSPETMINYQGQNSTIDEILAQLLEPLGLAYIPSGESLFITVPDFTDQDLLEETYAFDAFEPELSAEAMANIIRTFIAPDSWESAGGEATISRQNHQLRITQTKAGHSATRRLLTKLQGVHDTPEIKSATRTHNPTKDDPLAQIITYGTRQPLSLASFLRQLSSRIDQNIVLDELALLRSGISSDQLIEVELKKWPLQDLLKETFTRFGLALEIMDDHTIVVTSESRGQSSMVLRIYAIPPSTTFDDEKLIATIREQIAPNSWFSRGGNGRVLVEKNSRMLIVLQELGVHREVRNYLGGFSGE